MTVQSLGNISGRIRILNTVKICRRKSWKTQELTGQRSSESAGGRTSGSHPQAVLAEGLQQLLVVPVAHLSQERQQARHKLALTGQEIQDASAARPLTLTTFPPRPGALGKWNLNYSHYWCWNLRLNLASIITFPAYVKSQNNLHRARARTRARRQTHVRSRPEPAASSGGRGAAAGC